MTDLSDLQDVKLDPRGFQKSHVPEAPDEELAGLGDHRVVLVLRDAVLGRKQAAQKAKVEPIVRQKIEQTKVATPGPSDKGRPKATPVAKARQALAKTGRIQDATELIRLQLSDLS